MVRNALLLGIQDYGVGVGPILSAPKDIDALNDVLSHTDVGYFHSIHVVKDEVVCTEPGKKPVPSAELATVIQSWCRSHEPDDLALLYWSGQGFRDQSGALFLAVSNTCLEADGLVDSATIPMYRLVQWLNQSSAREQVIVLDCCFRDGMGQSLSEEDEALNFQPLLDDGSRTLKRKAPSPPVHRGGCQRVVLSACTTANYFPEQKSDRLSLYTRYWIEGLMTGAADSSEKQWVSVADVHRYVEHQMQVALPNVQPLLLDPDQIAATIRLGKVRIPVVHRQYRQAVQDVAELSPYPETPDGQRMGHALASHSPISAVGRQILDLQRHQWGLSSDCAQVIEQQVVHPLEHYRNSLNNYRGVMANLLEGRVFNEQVEHRLQDQRRRLGLRLEDVATINHELSYLQTLRRGQQYRQALKRAIATEDVMPFDLRVPPFHNSSDQGAILPPIMDRTRQELRVLQGMLDLSDEDITLIEQDVMAERTTHHQRLAHYRQRYIQALSQGIALSPLVREELDILQQRLDLSNDDVEKVEWLVKQGNLQPLPLETDPLPSSSSEQRSEQRSEDQSTPRTDPYGPTPSPGANPTPDSGQPLPPGALPLTPQVIQFKGSDGVSTDPEMAGGWGSELTTPTLFSLSPSDPTVLGTAPVFPTPLAALGTVSPQTHTVPIEEPKTNSPQDANDGNPEAGQSSIPPDLDQEDLQKRIAQYETAFLTAIARQFPVSEDDRQALHHLQHMLKLSDNQVRLINQRIVDQVNQQEAYYHHTKIQDYAQQFVARMKQEWPLSENHRATLVQLQRQLELHDVDVHVLEQQLMAQHQVKTVAPPVEAPALNVQDPEVQDPAVQEHLVTELMPPVVVTSESADSSTIPHSPPLSEDQPSVDSPTPDSSPVNESPSPEPVTQDRISPPFTSPLPMVQEHSTPTHSTPTQNSSESIPTELESPSDTADPPSAIAPGKKSMPPVMGQATTPGVPLLTDRKLDYGALETYLRQQSWQEADEETLDMMRKATARRVKWLDRQAILELPCADLKTIDALWSKYSQGHFGFRVQQEIFKSTQASNSNVARFGQEVGWTLWQSKWVGFKYYQQLTFDLSAPAGHLPAKWFWMVPWWESVRSGGLGGRGGCGGDASELLAAMMLYQFLD